MVSLEKSLAARLLTTALTLSSRAENSLLKMRTGERLFTFGETTYCVCARFGIIVQSGLSGAWH